MSTSWSADGKYLVTGGADNSVKVWDVVVKHVPILPAERVTAYLATAFSPANELLAVGVTSDNQVKLWNLSTGQEIVKLKEPADDLLCAVFSPDRKLLAIGRTDSLVTLWETATWVRSLNGHSLSVYGLAFRRRKMLISGGAGRLLNLWEVVTGQGSGLVAQV
jgi:hypothetical protein